MPSWTNKDARQYEHIKESSLERGRSEADAEEIAARTVNKQRRLHGETPSRTTSGTGNPNRPLESRSVQELRNRAAELHISGRSKMRKQALIEAIRGRS
ncbi:MAG: Rho termination factor N-terminal domain-containing protein [Planctomycetaceae bacterium]